MSNISSRTRATFITTNESHFVLRAAIASRLLVLALIVLWRSILTPYDTSALLNPNCLASDPNAVSRPVMFPAIGSAIEGSIVWDGVYFVRIAQCGYEYEQTYAFLPLLPICINAISRSVFAPLVPVIGYRAVLGLSGYLINFVAFSLAAVCFYKLSLIVLKDRKASLQASIMFCFNPASIFYSSVYSESLYSLFSLGGLYYLLSGSNTIAVLLLALSGSARSNGVLNAGYFCFQAMHQAYDAILQKNHGLAVQALIAGAVRSVCIFVPFIVFQLYGYYNLCLGHLPGEMRPWCKARIPFLYDYIQSHYWGVGFLRYFELKQLPNFLLASPILSLALCSIVHYAKLQPELVFSLGFRASNEEKDAASVLYLLGPTRKSKDAQPLEFFSSKILQVLKQQHGKALTVSVTEDPTIRKRKHNSKEDSDSFQDSLPSNHERVTPAKQGYSSILILPFVLHLGFMAATAFLVMHVQVATRFLSSSPALYWFSSYLMNSYRSGCRWGNFIWAYSAAYILLGSLLFSNFYPFT